MIKDIETHKNEPPWMFVKDYSELIHASEILSKETVMGVDLESDSMFHYREKICLIQISAPKINILIDTLQLKDLSPLLPIFSDRRIRKVFHGADYDTRSLFRDFKVEIDSLFDTQIAARFLGINQTGLSSIIESRFNVFLEKKYQKSDWSKRPLSREMLRYAVLDTYYLIPLSRMLDKELREKGRFAWFQEECDLQSRVRFSPSKDEPLFLRFKGASKLPHRELAILDELLRWREAIALSRDIPPFKILGNQQIQEIVDRKPVAMDGLNILSPKQLNSMGKSILKIVRKGISLHENDLPSYPKEKRRKQSASTLKKINALKKWREEFAEKTGLNPSVICPNSLIQAICLMDQCSFEDLKGLHEMRKWQIDLFGREVCDLLASNCLIGPVDS